jgi:hypothetical protein
MSKQITVGLDVFSHIWSSRLPHENSEDQILTRLLKIGRSVSSQNAQLPSLQLPPSIVLAAKAGDKPRSKKWTDVLIWTLSQYGGRATLSEVYKTSREGRGALGIPVTSEHAASARECLESHCKGSHKYRGKADLFYMPEGKGAGVWALRK